MLSPTNEESIQQVGLLKELLSLTGRVRENKSHCKRSAKNLLGQVVGWGERLNGRAELRLWDRLTAWWLEKAQPAELPPRAVIVAVSRPVAKGCGGLFR